MNTSQRERTPDQFVIDVCSDHEEWNSFVKRNDGPVYALSGWGKAVGSYGHDFWHLVVRDRESQSIVGGLPLSHVQSRLFGSKLLSPAFAVRGSVIHDDESPKRVKQLLLDQTKRVAKELDVDVVTLRGSPSMETDDFVEKNRYVTFQVQVDRDASVVWSEIDDERQQQIRTAADNPSLQFEVGDSLADLREFYQLYLRMMRRLGNPPHSFDFFRTMWEEFHDSGVLRLSMIRSEGSLIDARIDLSLGSTVYQYCVVVDGEHRELHGGSWLLWKSLEWATGNGYETYDLSRTREGSAAYTFKQSFGGSETWYDDLHYFPNGTVNLSDPEDGKYKRARAVWRRLPLPVSRTLGPLVRKRIGL